MQRTLQPMLNAALMLAFATATFCAAAAPGAVESAREYRQAHEAEILAGYAEFLRLPNVAADLDDMQRNAAWMRERFAARGVELETLALDGVPPLVAGRIDVPGAERTLGITKTCISPATFSLSLGARSPTRSLPASWS